LVKENLDRNHGTSLRNSEEIVGMIYPVLRDARGRVIDGFHRLGVDPNWDSVTLKNVKTKEDRLLVSLHANLGRRMVSREEKAKAINSLAEIYWKEGLRPKVTSVIVDREGRNNHIVENQITNRLREALKGVVGKSTINSVLLPKYKNQEYSENHRRVAKVRHDNTSAIKLIQDSFGNKMIGQFGVGIFGRLEREMISAAKEMLRNDPWWIKTIKDELRDEIRAEIIAARASK